MNNPKGVNMFLEFKSSFSKKRNYGVFDFISWFNGESDLKLLDNKRINKGLYKIRRLR